MNKAIRLTTTLALLFVLAISVEAQWLPNGATSGNIYNSNTGGNVGIGLTNPTDRLYVNGNIGMPLQKAIGFGHSDNFTYDNKTISSYSLGWYNDSGNTGAPMSYYSGFGGIKFFTNRFARMFINQSGNVGIGTTTPSERLSVAGNLLVDGNISLPLQKGIGFGYTDAFTYDNKAVGNYTIGWYSDSWNPGASTTYYSGFGGMKFFTQSFPRMVITQSGNVGIGTVLNPDAKLTVRGDIHANEVRVDLLGAAAPDYVFNADYKLIPLAELQAYLKQNSHLPEIPSAKAMEENGIYLKEMNLLLLKKVEELTLYMIELESKNVKQDELINELIKAQSK